jgi:amino acid transporter
VAVNALIIFVLTVESSFLSALGIATITRLLVYATTCVSLPIFRARDRDAAEPQAKFTAPFGNVAAAISLVLIIWLLTSVDFTGDGLRILIIAGVGLVIYFAGRAFRKRP